MKNIFLLLVGFVMFNYGCSFSQPKNERNPKITVKEVQDHVNYLASDELEGRFTGSEGANKAAAYIKQDFKEDGLLPFFDKDYSESYPFVSGLEAGIANKVKLLIDGKEYQLKFNDEFIAANFSDNVKYSGEVVFAGYSITAPELNYDDYSSIDVKGKIVLAMRYNPEEKNPRSKFDKYAELRLKAKTAQEKGAAGIIFVNGYVPKDEDDNLIKLSYDGAPAMKELGAIHIKRSLVDKMFEAEKLNFKLYQQNIDTTKKPASFVFKNSKIELVTEVKQVEGKGINIAGYLPGNDPKLKDEYIIIGAHYDHLGYGETGSLYRGKDKQIHNGADDNASGTTGVLELAEKFAAEKDKNKRSIIFVTFSGEELGMLGSNYFVQKLSIPYKNITAMINLDMIGRMNDEKSLIVYGTGTSHIWKDVLNKSNKEYNFKLTFNDEGFGPSDQTSFYAKEIPVLFFFTGTHSDYHRPSDDADKINSTMEAKILDYVYQIAEGLDTSITRPDYVNVPRKDTGGPTKFKVYIGTTPDFGAQVDGYKISGVTDGSPAQKSGLLAGDIIIEFGKKKVSNIYDYMYAMNEFSPGEKVEIVVMRGEEKLNLTLELAAK
ncbi:MAG: M20/M25/M40 family metallo-hydrolase [Ignavibacteriales bacterium]|nr:M20/M25/M40 family metallo-hydrolase [Ignavibacteriales bacterium]